MNNKTEYASTEKLSSLQEATLAKDSLAVENLITAGADVNETSADGLHPIFMLLNQSKNSGLLFFCDLDEWSEIISLYLNSEKFDTNSTNEQGRTLLSLYCESDIENSNFTQLLTPRTDVNKPDHDGNTPMHFACFAGNMDYIIALLNAGASISKKNLAGETPLDRALSAHSIREEEYRYYRDLTYIKESFKFHLRKKIADSCAVIELLLDAGAGLYVDSTPLPDDINTNGKVLINFRVNDKPVDRQTEGFAQAITTLKELRIAILNGTPLCRKPLIQYCSDRLMHLGETVSCSEGLKELHRSLYQLTPNTLVNCCFNIVNQSPVELRKRGLKILPEELKNQVMPEDEAEDRIQINLST